MCGITAISRPAQGSSIPDARDFMRHALRAIEPRGEHATGAAWPDHLGHPWYWKEAGAASQLAGRIPFPTNMRAAIGHTRYATKGSPKRDENNHPIIGDALALVHNGRVDNDDALISATGWERQGQVDSEALAALLSNPAAVGAKGPADALELVKGVASLAWISAAEPFVLHLARTSVRPMTIGRTRRGDLVMSSTPETLQETARTARVRICDIEEIPEGTYLRVQAGEITKVEAFRPHHPTRPVPADVAATKRPMRGNVIDGIDWSNLVPRRGWK